METMRQHAIAALDEVAMMKQNLIHAEAEKKHMTMVMEQAEMKAADENRMRQHTIAEAQGVFRDQEHNMQKEREQSRSDQRKSMERIARLEQEQALLSAAATSVP
eukprot:12911747-Prorocentrum_lima.AAC.1